MSGKAKTHSKKTVADSTAVLFNHSTLQSNDVFIHCVRIPDVMVRVIKARELLKKYGVQPPAWMFGLTYKGDKLISPIHFQLMAFLNQIGSVRSSDQAERCP